MKYAIILSGRIRSLCQEHGYSINSLATMSGLRQSTINNILNGTSKSPGIKTLHKIAITFSMTVSEFLDFPELNDYSPDEDEDECDK